MRRVTSNQFANNAMWKFADMISNKLILLVITILLARLITPEAYGVVALTMVFIGFSDIFILNGFNIALIRKETVDGNRLLNSDSHEFGIYCFYVYDILCCSTLYRQFL